MDPAPSSGDRYSISPVVFRVRYWPLSVGEGRGYPRYLFARRVVKAMSVLVSDLSGAYDGVNGKLTVGVFREGSNTMHSSKQEVALATNPADCYEDVSCDGTVLIPGVECYGADVGFELISTLVNVTFTRSRNVE
jgi:hypothetical protein